MQKLVLIVLILIVACWSTTNSSDKIDIGSTETSVMIQWGGVNYELQSSLATLENSKLKLYIDRHPDSLSDYAIEILQQTGGLKVVMEQPWSIADSSYVRCRFKVLNQQILLNKDQYQIGNKVVGKLDLLIEAHKSYFRETGEMSLRNNWDTIKASGIFSATVK